MIYSITSNGIPIPPVKNIIHKLLLLYIGYILKPADDILIELLVVEQVINIPPGSTVRKCESKLTRS